MLTPTIYSHKSHSEDHHHHTQYIIINRSILWMIFQPTNKTASLPFIILRCWPCRFVRNVFWGQPSQLAKPMFPSSADTNYRADMKWLTKSVADTDHLFFFSFNNKLWNDNALFVYILCHPGVLKLISRIDRENQSKDSLQPLTKPTNLVNGTVYEILELYCIRDLTLLIVSLVLERNYNLVSILFYAFECQEYFQYKYSSAHLQQLLQTSRCWCCCNILFLFGKCKWF